MKEDKLSLRIFMAILGVIVMGAGIGMTVKVGIGVSPIDSVNTGLSGITGLTVGTCTALTNLTFFLIAYFLYKKNVGISTIVFILISKFPIDFFNEHFIHSDKFLISILLSIFSNMVVALGSELFINSRLGASSYDAFTMGIGKRLKHEYKYVYIRWGCDGIMLIIGYLIGGSIGVGTVISFMLVGPFMKMWQPLVEKVFKIEEPVG